VHIYNTTCGVHGPPANCPDLLSQFELPRNLAVGSFIAAGLAGGASITFTVLYLGKAHSPPPKDRWTSGLGCGPGGAGSAVGLSCSGAW
jgi:hypothetical protein